MTRIIVGVFGAVLLTLLGACAPMGCPGRGCGCGHHHGGAAACEAPCTCPHHACGRECAAGKECARPHHKEGLEHHDGCFGRPGGAPACTDKK